MGAIAFSDKPEECWVVAGWAFRQVLDDTASQYPNDFQIMEAFDEAKAISGLMIHMLKPELASKVTLAIRSVVTGILAGTIRSSIFNQAYGDERTVEEYRRGLYQLLDTFPSTQHGCD
jgi:hypothetical protein